MRIRPGAARESVWSIVLWSTVCGRHYPRVQSPLDHKADRNDEFLRSAKTASHCGAEHRTPEQTAEPKLARLKGLEVLPIKPDVAGADVLALLIQDMCIGAHPGSHEVIGAAARLGLIAIASRP